MRYMIIIELIILLCLPAGLSAATLQPGVPDPQQAAIGQTPPRLSFVDGRVSFWRPGSPDWTAAQLNIPLAPGDRLHTGSPGNLELQVGSRAFVRAWANSEIGLQNQEPDFLQFTVTAGGVSFDLRTLAPGRTVQIDTPNATFTIDHAGYYRIEAADEHTVFIARRGGRAVVSPAGGGSLAIAPNEAVAIEGAVGAGVTAYAAPQLDEWDRWNYARTDQLLEAASARYVSPQIYGAAELDTCGTWRTLPTYGPVWFPAALPPGWVPYGSGIWMKDSFYGWSWVGTEPWGWAPYHYGRWVFVNGLWGWVPGPVLARPVYAPALVAFLGGPGAAVGIVVNGGPVVSWVALGWGEPLVPWWGPKGFIHRPWWGGWGGPRIVNNGVIKKTTVVEVQNIRIYRNVAVHKAVVAVSKEHFGRSRIEPAHRAKIDAKRFKPDLTASRIGAARTAIELDASRNIRLPGKNPNPQTAADRLPRATANRTPVKKSAIQKSKVLETPRSVRETQRRKVSPVLKPPAVARSDVERPAAGQAPRLLPTKIKAQKRAAQLPNTGPAADRMKGAQFRREPQAAAPSKAVRASTATRPEARHQQRRYADGSANSFSSLWPGRNRVQR